MLGEPHFVKRAGIDVVRVLLEQGARVNEKDFTGKTALGFTKDHWEIDEALWGHPGVEDAVVIKREDHPGERSGWSSTMWGQRRPRPCEGICRRS
jgi:hypothetical protein